MLLLSERDVRELLSMRECIDVLRSAFLAQAHGRVKMPLRTMAASTSGILGAMPASIQTDGAALGAKLVTVFPGNTASEMPTHQALILSFDPTTGEPLCLMDGRYITEIRTAATSALATEALAVKGASVVAIIGTGVQAHAHVDALPHVMNVREVRVWGRTAAKAEALGEHARRQGINARTAATVADACAGAHVVCTVTSSTEPVLNARELDRGTHVNAVGMAPPNGRELSSDLMKDARIIVDSLDGARKEAAEIRLAIAEGALPPKPELILLCDVIAGKAQGRHDDNEVTVFESLGLALEDISTAAFVVERARAQRRGQEFAL
ncbi:MAG: ornithine cyclodeaminase [Candidatus Eremiobacter antarcticus]|nr:ornithine cyclodeaminase family protein [Candidatus Eremiobacteraeota bacterium]MBC5807053.1 ornithine cyclodeaminase family protein [Candidatus Eremiobacteraeota bacterium]PZR62819.1 MAG: ornithine cyclodeaminase [Candidatus Eremiobacter sp. RRmetagenome_bin22]